MDLRANYVLSIVAVLEQLELGIKPEVCEHSMRLTHTAPHSHCASLTLRLIITVARSLYLTFRASPAFQITLSDVADVDSLSQTVFIHQTELV